MHIGDRRGYMKLWVLDDDNNIIYQTDLDETKEVNASLTTKNGTLNIHYRGNLKVTDLH